MPVVDCAILLKSGNMIEFRGDIKASYREEDNKLMSLSWTVEEGEVPVWLDLDQVAAVVTRKDENVKPKPAPLNRPMAGAASIPRGTLTAVKVTKEQREAEEAAKNDS